MIMHSDEPVGRTGNTAGSRRPKQSPFAYVVAGPLGLNTSLTSISYVTGWSDGDTDTIRDTAEESFMPYGR